jgi:hypothetical protein
MGPGASAPAFPRQSAKTNPGHEHRELTLYRKAI